MKKILTVLLTMTALATTPAIAYAQHGYHRGQGHYGGYYHRGYGGHHYYHNHNGDWFIPGIIGGAIIGGIATAATAGCWDWRPVYDPYTGTTYNRRLWVC